MTFTDLKTLYSQAPPAFGKEMRKHFAMDPEYANLNNGQLILTSLLHSHCSFISCTNETFVPGSYGTPPRAVLQAALDISAETEVNPDRFHRYGYQERLKDARTQLAKLIGAHADEVVLVNNASTGVGTVMRNFHWEEGDVIIVCE